jgi:S1-C subfamily serine protease
MHLLWLTAALTVNAATDAVFRIETVYSPHDFASPWERKSPGRASGTGFLVGKNRILTNAHVVADTQQLLVKRHDRANPAVAKVLFIGHDCDLAMLQVEDESFLKGLTPIEVGPLPKLRSTVTTLGYPTGGEELSSTRGVLSRLEMRVYSHTGADQHLALQTDAAINPGNSGGPVMLDNKAIGVAFQSLRNADNIGYVIPAPVVQHFLNDITDGKYDGFPTLGTTTQRTISPALRKERKLPDNVTGIVIQRVQPQSMADGLLQAGDVWSEIDGKKIDNDGSTPLDESRVDAEHWLDMKQVSEKANITVWRSGKPLSLSLVAKSSPTEKRQGPSYETPGKYVLYAGLLFQPVSVNLVRDGLRLESVNASEAAWQHFVLPLVDAAKQQEEAVFLTRVLKHPVNSQMVMGPGEWITRINGKPIRSLQQVKEAIGACQNGFLVLESSPLNFVDAIDCEAAKRAHPEVLKFYGIANDARL